VRNAAPFCSRGRLRENTTPRPSASASASSTTKGLGLIVVGFIDMDGFGIVYLIENAQQFWSGALWKVGSTASTQMALTHFS
jgi:hypothetical protein